MLEDFKCFVEISRDLNSKNLERFLDIPKEFNPSKAYFFSATSTGTLE